MAKRASIEIAVSAKGTISFSGVVVDGQKVTIGNDIYEFDTNAAVTEGNILVDVSGGVTATLAATALNTAINASATEAVSSVKLSATSVTVIADVPGTVAESIALSETCTNGAWDFATLTGGFTARNVPLDLGGFPVVETLRLTTTVALTNVAIIPGGQKIFVTRVSYKTADSCTAAPSVRIGFNPSVTPSGVGVISSHPGVPNGGGVVEGNGGGILGVGQGNPLLVTCSEPTGGALDINVSYFLGV